MGQSSVQKVEDWRTFPNESGLTPLGHAVLVQPYEPEVKSGLLHIPEEVKRNMHAADQRAIVIAVGPNAWSGEGFARAVPGDRVLVTKYAGYFTSQTKDGKPYRLVNDKDIFCRIDWE